MTATKILVRQLNLRFPQGSDPTFRFTLTDETTTGKEATDLTGATVELIIKDSKTVADSTGVTRTSSLDPAYVDIDDDPTTGKVTVNFTAADVGSTATQWYHLDVIRNGRRMPYAFGELQKDDI